MRYIGGLTGQGILKSFGEDIVRVSYDLDGYFNAPARVSSNGEIQLPSAAVKSLLGVSGLQLQTADGRLLDLKVAAKDLTSRGDTLHVDIVGGLPATPADWLH